MPVAPLRADWMAFPRGDIGVRLARTTADRSACLDLRREVFIAEQGVSEADEWDGLDDGALHFLAVEEGRPVGTARMRWMPGGQAKAERVAVVATRRHRGVGRLLMEAVVAQAAAGGATRVVLGAQVSAIPFYERLGWTADGPVFDDAGIPHRHMQLALDAPGAARSGESEGGAVFPPGRRTS